MREIKFRAMMDKPHPSHGSVWVYCSGIPTSSWLSKNGTYYGEIQRDTIGEFTGLKDKNGKEIYEGDVIRIDSTAIGGDVYTGEVIFNTDNTLSNLEWGLWLKHGYLPTDFLGDIEVIGNIYENPELIK